MSFQAEIAQLVEHATENCGVASPILALGTRPENQATCGRSTVVVRLLAKEKVVGSNPIARSTGCGLMIDDCSLSIKDPQSGIWIRFWRRGQVARQGSAKPSSWVQIPSTPLLIVDCGLMITE